MANLKKNELLKETIEHIDIAKFDARPLVDAYSKMAYSARDLARASDIYDRMLADKDCDVILCLAGSLFSAATFPGAANEWAVGVGGGDQGLVLTHG